MKTKLLKLQNMPNNWKFWAISAFPWFQNATNIHRITSQYYLAQISNEFHCKYYRSTGATYSQYLLKSFLHKLAQTLLCTTSFTWQIVGNWGLIKCITLSSAETWSEYDYINFQIVKYIWFSKYPLLRII